MDMINNSGAKNTLSVGGKVLPLAGLKSLMANLSGATSFSTFRESTTVAANGYQVPVGKKFVIHAVVMVGSYTAANANVGPVLAYGDTDQSFGGSDPANVWWQCANSESSLFACNVVKERQEAATYFEVPAGKYPGVKNWVSAAGPARIQVWGYEVNA